MYMYACISVEVNVSIGYETRDHEREKHLIRKVCREGNIIQVLWKWKEEFWKLKDINGNEDQGDSQRSACGWHHLPK